MKPKNNFLRYSATLFIICVIASGLLSSVYTLTKDKITAQAEGEKQQSLQEVLPCAREFCATEFEGATYYTGYDARGSIVGYAFLAQQRGYSSDIITMVGITADGTIQGIKILSQNETPGLGSKIIEVKEDKTIWSVFAKKIKIAAPAKPWFQQQFIGQNVHRIEGVETITGATISSQAVIESIKEEAKRIMRALSHGN